MRSVRAAQRAALSRVEFLETAGRYRVPSLHLTANELEQDAANA
ncbi:MAG: hypothetical protein FJ395_20040 [Verrucomicrobia bacterium]|nr:hypothetical protein [Verrucomicrobiota bacterium]